MVSTFESDCDTVLDSMVLVQFSSAIPTPALVCDCKDSTFIVISFNALSFSSAEHLAVQHNAFPSLRLVIGEEEVRGESVRGETGSASGTSL